LEELKEYGRTSEESLKGSGDTVVNSRIKVEAHRAYFLMGLQIFSLAV
jgi:hypothetical protein